MAAVSTLTSTRGPPPASAPVWKQRPAFVAPGVVQRNGHRVDFWRDNCFGPIWGGSSGPSGYTSRSAADIRMMLSGMIDAVSQPGCQSRIKAMLSATLLNDLTYDFSLVSSALLQQVLAPLAVKHRFADDLKGHVAMWESIDEHIDKVEVRDLRAAFWYTFWFGPETDDAALVMLTRWNSILPADMTLNFTFHKALPPLERRLRSEPRTIAGIELAFRGWYASSFDASYPSIWTLDVSVRRRPLVIWILGATDAHEGELARSRYFEDAARLLNVDSRSAMELMTVHLIGDVAPEGFPCGQRVRVHAHPSLDLLWPAQQQMPDMVILFHTGAGTLEPNATASWIPQLVELLSMRNPWPVIVTVCRCEAEVRGERALLGRLGANCLRHERNVFSGMAGDPNLHYDDYGWFLFAWSSCLRPEALRRLNPESVLQGAVQELEEEAAERASGAEKGGCHSDIVVSDGAEKELATASVLPLTRKPKSPAVFWGILDLKYDPEAPLRERVKVLETGDGRTSRFSGAGAAIKQAFRHDHKLEETLDRALLVENKKIIHDLFCECDYAHVLPRQVVCPRTYTKDLAPRIVSQLRLCPTSMCMLKLCNRSRGAGCIPTPVAELDDVLRGLLMPPCDVGAWLSNGDSNFFLNAQWGCYEEQCRHWWSNECPCFIAEQLCASAPIRRKSRDFDGTMRLGFSLHRHQAEYESAGSQGYMLTGRGVELIGRSFYEDARPEDWNAVVLLPGTNRPDALRIQWLGGYWKLPEEDIHSMDLRARVISKASQGTTTVRRAQLHEVYASLGDVVQQIFSLRDVGPSQLMQRYVQFPEFSAFVFARLSTSMRVGDQKKRQMALQLAESVNRKGSGGQPQAGVESYITRCFGIFEALSGSWQEATQRFERAIAAMPTNATARFLQGMCHLEAGEWLLAISAMEASLNLDPDFKAPYVNLGVARLGLLDWQGAIAVCEAGLRRHPQTPHCLYNIGIASYMLACKAEADAASHTGSNYPVTAAAADAIAWRRRARSTLESARAGLGKNRREGVARGAAPPERIPSKKYDPLAGIPSADVRVTDDQRPSQKKASLWTEADDEALSALSADPIVRLPPLRRREGWKFYGWRP